MAEHPHDTEALVPMVRVVRQEQDWTSAELAEAAEVPATEVARFEAQEIVPAKPLAMRFLATDGSRLWVASMGRV